ncbi:hypothetical protein CDAR_85541 [Caerostris darwini]|uniref:Uncharacterized protein n=1 Tax=Caerostris darwini TaxID=1538125 RepID=A0AAV4QXF4_9ARAC|nr:hypothetical protein CDAR_85541 [Caerostris darwini]
MKRNTTCIHKFSEKGFLVKRTKSASDFGFRILCVYFFTIPRDLALRCQPPLEIKTVEIKGLVAPQLVLLFFRESRQETQWKTGTTNVGANFKDLSVVPGKQRCVKPEK